MILTVLIILRIFTFLEILTTLKYQQRSTDFPPDTTLIINRLVITYMVTLMNFEWQAPGARSHRFGKLFFFGRPFLLEWLGDV